MSEGDGIEITGKDLKVIAKQLRGVDNRELKKRFTRELRAAAKPMVPAVRSAIRSTPTSGTRSTGLRKRIAKATKLTVRTSGREAGVALRVDGRKMPDGEKSLPSMLEGRKRWRHPVFGNREKWVQQESHPYFERATGPLRPRANAAVQRAVESIVRDII